MFETRSHSWREVGLMRQIDVEAVKRARVRGVVFLALFVAVKIVNDHREELFHVNSPVRWIAVVAMVILGWAMAGAIGAAFAPSVFRRMDPATAGTVGFFARLIALLVALLIALRTAGIATKDLTIGASFAAVIFGLAAQQTLGNLIAGTVLLSARPFRVGDRVRLQAGGVGGQIEGVVSSLGLLYTTFASGEDMTMVPNSVVLNCAVIPLREPDSIDLRARLGPGVTPGNLQRLFEQSLSTLVRRRPHVALEEVSGEEVVVRITATPKLAADGEALAAEILRLISSETRAAGGPADAGHAMGPGSGGPAWQPGEDVVGRAGEDSAHDDDGESDQPEAARTPPAPSPAGPSRSDRP
jgi:small conductance mechanosensitive channel